MKNLVGIVGGAGSEGSYFAEIMQNSGLEVAIADTNIEKANALCSERGYRCLPSEELVQNSNLVLFSLPIEVTPSEIKRLAPLAKESVADLTSVKTKAVDAMVKYAPKEVEVFSVHAMYRPTVSPWGQNVLMVSERPKEGGRWFNVIKSIMEKRKANVSTLESAQQHDEFAAALQVLPHATAYAFLTALERFAGKRLPLAKLQEYSTLFSRLMMDATGRVVSDPKAGSMYGLIQAENPHTALIYNELIRSLSERRRMLVAGKEPDIAAFAEKHAKLSAFLGEYAKTAAERTDRLMGRPLGLQIVYEKGLHDVVENALGKFRKAPEEYVEDLETARIPEGELNKLHKKGIVLAKWTFYKAKGSKKEGNYAFYIHGKKLDGKGVRFSPVIPEDLGKDRDPGYVRIQMYNRFHDPFLNLWDTWKRTPNLHSLGNLVAYKTN